MPQKQRIEEIKVESTDVMVRQAAGSSALLSNTQEQQQTSQVLEK